MDFLFCPVTAEVVVVWQCNQHCVMLLACLEVYLMPLEGWWIFSSNMKKITLEPFSETADRHCFFLSLALSRSAMWLESGCEYLGILFSWFNSSECCWFSGKFRTVPSATFGLAWWARGVWSDEDKLKSFVHSCAGAPVFRNRCSTDGKMEDFRIFYRTEWPSSWDSLGT